MLRLLLCLFLSLHIAVSAIAQDDAPATPDRSALINQARLERETLEANRELAEDARAAIAATLDQAERALAEAATAAERTTEWRTMGAEAPTLLAAIREEIAQPPAEIVLPDIAELSLPDLEQRLSDANAQLATARTRVTELQAEADRRQSRRSEIPPEIAELRRQLELVSERRASQTLDPEQPLSRARQLAVVSEEFALRAKIETLEAELACYDARRDLLPARRDRANKRVTERERIAEVWLDVVNRRRQSDAEAAAREAERRARQAAREHPALREFAEETQRLAQERAGPQGIPALLSAIESDSVNLRRTYANLREQYQSLRRRLDVSGLNRATGVQLRRQYETLPDIQSLRKRAAALRNSLEDAEYMVIDRREMRDAAGNIQAVVDNILAPVIAENPDLVTPELQAAARELATARRDLLDQLVADAIAYADQTAELEAINRVVRDATISFESFIGERILWVRSITGKRLPTIDEYRTSISRLSDLSMWQQIITAIRRDVERRWPTTLFVVLGLLGLFWVRSWSKQRIREIGELTRGFRTDNFTHTLKTVALTIVGGLAWPTFFYWLGWLIAKPPLQHHTGVALGIGLQHGALLLLPLAITSRALRRNSLAELHFRWPTPVVQRLRSQLRWFMPVVLPLLAIVVAADTLREEDMSSAIGRTAFIGAMAASMVFIYTTMNPKSVVFADYFRKNSGTVLYRIRWLLFDLMLIVPMALSFIALMGYYYSALQLLKPLEQTLVLLLITLFIHSMLLRWLFITRRKVAVEDARRRREQALAEEAKAQTTGLTNEPTPESTVPTIDADKLDLPAINAQTRQLFRTVLTVSIAVAMYFTWTDVLPALRSLQRVQVWPSFRVIEATEAPPLPLLEAAPPVLAPSTHTTTTPGAAQDATRNNQPAQSIPGMPIPTGAPTAASPQGELEEQSNITLHELGLALILGIATLAAFRNLPGLIEILILKRLPLDAGSRYALTTVERYLIVFIGVLAASATLGISWSNIQWLVAALTFGLAFGLQEIFANFISGLIILAERPIRIGDTVTVDNVSGRVTKIRMRATTITDWDRKELIIPNKTFITGDVINWTLSDPVLRVRVPVGVSYGSDIDAVERVLFEIASTHPNVLADPKPSVVFSGFGDSTLDFELRCFIPHIDHLVPVRHTMHFRIMKRFREEGIEIAFPQRDLHIRSVEGLKQALSPSPAETPDPKE